MALRTIIGLGGGGGGLFIYFWLHFDVDLVRAILLAVSLIFDEPRTVYFQMT